MEERRAGDRERASELASLRIRLDEAEQTLRAIRSGEIDAIVVDDAVYTLDTANAASNRLRSDVLAQMKDAVVAVDLGGRVIYLNAAAESQYGMAASDALGHPLDRLYGVRWYGDGDGVRAEAELREAGSWRGESVHVRSDGSELHVESTLATLRDGNGIATGRLIVSRDVSERYHAAAALRSAMRELARSEREFSTLVENSPFIFARFDRALRHSYVSPQIEAYTGVPAVSFIGKTHLETGMLLELAAEWNALLERVFETGRVVETSFSLATPSGEIRHFEARLIPEVTAEGRVGSVLSVPPTSPSARSPTVSGAPRPRRCARPIAARTSSSRRSPTSCATRSRRSATRSRSCGCRPRPRCTPRRAA